MADIPKLGHEFPNFTAETSQGKINFHEFINNSWAILFSHPADFTPVCTTELGMVARMKPEFDKRGVKLVALSCDDVASHKGWIPDILQQQNVKGDDLPYPIIADKGRDIAIRLGMLDPDEKNAEGLAMAARCVFIIGPDKKLKLSLLYPATTGRNFDEIIRVIDSLQLTAYESVATPANWTAGKECMVIPSISNEEAKAKFPKGFKIAKMPSGKEYMRYTPDPRSKL